MKNFNEILTEERLELCRKDRRELQEKYFKEAEEKIGREAVDELRDLYSIYDERYYIWIAGLWEPEIGGFYFSNSARDTEGFLPDIESTVQALNCCQAMGLTYGKPYAEVVPEKMKEGLLRFTKGLQDPENGYFYHPQWGRRVVVPRRGRDLSWATSLFEAFGEKPNYPSPLDKTSDGKKSESLPEHFQTIEAFRKYLSEFDLSSRSYWVGNMLQSQVIQIRAAGQEFVDEMFAWLAEHQRSDNGLWQEKVEYDSVNGLMKLGLMYTTLGAYLPNAEAALDSTIDAAMSDQKITFCCQFYNPLTTICTIMHNMKKFGRAERAEELRAQLITRAPDLIRATKRKVSLCKRSDGSYGYNPTLTGSGCRRSQCAPVGLGLADEGDVNGGSISLNGVMRSLCQALGLPVIPAFGTEDTKLFYELIENATVKEKTNAKPEWFDSYLVEEGALWA